MDRAEAVAVVDFANTLFRDDSERVVFASKSSVHERMIRFIDLVLLHVRAEAPAVDQLQVRFYAGWIRSNGQETTPAVWARSHLSKLPRRVSSVRIRTKLATDLACCPGADLRGTHRESGQKMVDSMIVVDTGHFVQRCGAVFLVSDDDDFVPSALSAVLTPRSRANIFWLRRRALGDAVNDAHFADRDIRIAVLEGAQ